MSKREYAFLFTSDKPEAEEMVEFLKQKGIDSTVTTRGKKLAVRVAHRDYSAAYEVLAPTIRFGALLLGESDYE